jgi:hypothetical protein
MLVKVLPDTAMPMVGKLLEEVSWERATRNVLISELEEADLRFQPGDKALAPNRSGNDQLVVQPDALISRPPTRGVHMLVDCVARLTVWPGGVLVWGLASYQRGLAQRPSFARSTT